MRKKPNRMNKKVKKERKTHFDASNEFYFIAKNKNIFTYGQNMQKY